MRISDWSSDVCSSDLAWLFLYHKKPGEYHALANWYSFTFSPIFSANSEERTRLALLRAIARRLRGRATHISIRPVPDENGSIDLLTRAHRDGVWKGKSVYICVALGGDRILKKKTNN